MSWRCRAAWSRSVSLQAWKPQPVEGSLIVRLSDLSQYYSLEQRLQESGIGIEPVFTGLTAAVTKAGTPEADLACWYELRFSESADLTTG